MNFWLHKVLKKGTGEHHTVTFKVYLVPDLSLRSTEQSYSKGDGVTPQFKESSYNTVPLEEYPSLDFRGNSPSSCNFFFDFLWFVSLLEFEGEAVESGDFWDLAIVT